MFGGSKDYGVQNYSDYPGGIPQKRVWPPPGYEGKVKRGRFLKGPIPLAWISAAAELPGTKTLTVGLALWYLKGLGQSGEGLRISGKVREDFNLSDKVIIRALHTLEAAGLVRLHRAPGQKYQVDLIGLPGGER